MLNLHVKSFLQEVNNVCNNEICIKETSIRDKDNYFLHKIETLDTFKKINIERIKRLYSIYKNDCQAKNIIKNDIKKLFYNSWDGAYSELITYDLMNLIFDKPCKIQIEDIPIDNTLAKFCNQKEVSAIDGATNDGLVFFEIKTLTQRLTDLIIKLKNEFECRDENNYFVFTSDYPMSLEINGDQVYASLRNEIQEAKKTKKKFLSSEIVKGLNIKFYYEPKILDQWDETSDFFDTTTILIESHICEKTLFNLI